MLVPLEKTAMLCSSLMQWKPEPLSPPNIHSEEAWVSDEDVALYWPTLEQNNESFDDDLETLESKAEVATKILENLDNLNDLDDLIKEEPFANWLEDKAIPVFEDVVQSTCSPTISPVQIKPEQHITNFTLAPVQSDTQSLLQEFETIFDQVEMTHVALTPPHSPQYKSQFNTLVPIQEKQTENFTPPIGFIVHSHSHSQAAPIDVRYRYHNDSPPTPQIDVDHELAEVEELMRSRAQDMIHSPLSPTTSTSTSSNVGDYSSDDPEWTPELIESSPQVVPVLGKSREIRRQKPYARASNEDKKSRKKEQNKNAATRYRLKKKAEIEEILEEERNLAKRRGELDNQITDLTREIKYLKGLMRDLFKAKGLIK